MRRFSERNPKVTGAIGVSVLAAAVLVALQYDHLPFVGGGKAYSAYFTEAGGLSAGAPVQVAGVRVGQVSDVTLDGPRVLVTFTVDDGIHLGDRTEAAIKTKTLLGARTLSVSARGDGELSTPIPLDRTTSPYELPAALGDLATTINGLDTPRLNESLSTLAQTFANTPPDVEAAVKGVARISDTLNKRDTQLRQLLANANKVTGVLATRSDQLVSLVHDSNSLLAQLRAESDAIDNLSGNLASLANQLSGLVSDNKELRSSLERINGLLTVLDNHKADLQKSVKLLGQYSLSLGESVSGGPFFNGYIANLLPGQFVQPFIDAAFSDLGLDPATALPSLLTDPQVGQPATPALPIPFPRTGQGGEPNLTVPDAITGTPGDQPCGPPGVPLPGPGCYPYRQPLPQPEPGGPPPGPPAGYDARLAPTQAPVNVNPDLPPNAPEGTR